MNLPLKYTASYGRLSCTSIDSSPDCDAILATVPDDPRAPACRIGYSTSVPARAQ
jgi:hypothetical protein